VKGDYIIFLANRQGKEREVYKIPFSSIETKGALLHWIRQLVSKNWVTRQMISELIQIACKIHGIKIPDQV
jgi:hypothetical protein